MAFSLVRRQRRRRTVVVVLVVFLVILGTAYAVTRAQSDRQLRREYLDLALEVAGGQEDAAFRFSDVIIRLDELARPAVTETLSEVEESVLDLSRRIESAEPPPGRLGRAHVQFAVAAQQWKDGVIGARAGIETLSETPLDPDGLAVLEAGLIDLRVGDAAYAGFLAIVLEEEGEGAGRDFPVVAFIPEESELLFEATDIARRIFLTPDLGVIRNLAVADIKLDPAPIGDDEGIPVVPLSETLDAEVTVSNRGTVEETAIAVQLNVISGDGSQVTFDQSIDGIAPGALSSLLFEDLPVEPGGLYEIVATLLVDDDDAGDDVATLVFIRNAES
jgi:hypothetical protein